MKSWPVRPLKTGLSTESYSFKEGKTNICSLQLGKKKEKDAPTSPASKIDEIISFLRPQSTLGDTSKSRKAHLNPGLSNDTR